MATRAVLAVMLLGLTTAGCGLLGGEEQRVVRMLEAAAEQASVNGQESAVIRMASAARVARHFTEDFTVDGDLGAGTIRGRDGVAAAAAQARAAVAGLQVRVADVDVALPSPDTATAHLTLVVSGGGASGEGRPSGGAAGEMFDAREILLTLRKVDGDWLVPRADRLSTLERP